MNLYFILITYIVSLRNKLICFIQAYKRKWDQVPVPLSQICLLYGWRMNLNIIFMIRN